MPIRLSGMSSGLDTEAIVSALVSAYDYKKQKYTKAQTKLTWKQDAWKSLNSKVYSLYNTVGSMRLSSSYSMKKTTVSDATKATITASGSAMNGTQTLKINQLAQAGYLTGGQLAKGTTKNSKLVDLKYSGGNETKGKISVKSGDKTTDIEVDSTTTVDDFVKKLNDAGVNASFDESNRRIFVTSKDTGAENDFSIYGLDTRGYEALSSLGLLTGDGTSAYASASAFVVNDGTGAYDAEATKSKILQSVNSIHNSLVAQKSVPKKQQEISTKLHADEDLFAATFKDGEGKAKTYTQLASEAASDNDLVEGTENTVKSTKIDALYEKVMSDTTAYKNYYVEVKNEDGEVDDDASEAATRAKLEEVYDSFISGSQELVDLNTQLANANALVHDIKTATLDPEAEGYDTDKAYLRKIYEFDPAMTEDDWLQVDPLIYANKIFGVADTSVQIAAGTIDVAGDATANRVYGQDAEIELNGASFTGATNTFTINGLTIQATGVTGPNESIQVTTSTDTSGLYDKVKEFLQSYNNIINEMMKLYNADSAADYEPLTDDEKAEMSDTEIEKWEQKIKDSLLRRDTNLNSLITSMTMSMMQVVKINGEEYSWSKFGIGTLGFLNAEKNENYAYHIDGDTEDTLTSGKEDKLTAALASDPDAVIEFMKKMSSNLYDALDTKMKSTSVSSVYTVYNDKEMASEYSDYSSLIKNWTKRVSDMEESYYKKFAAMEKALATLQGNSSSVTSLLG